MKKTALLVAFVCLIAVVVLAARFYFSDGDFNMTNPAWNGISNIIGARPLYGLSGLSGVSSADTLLIIGPAENYTYDESLQVSSFLRRGGSVVVMDDFGKANSMLRAIDSPISINPVPLCQYDNYYKNQTFPIISNIADTPYTKNVSTLVMNHPVALDVTGDAEIIASTSGYGWLDRNCNSMLDNGERAGTYPVAACSDYGNGELIVVSDPDLFINGMLDKGDNLVFMRGLLHGNVWADVSHGHSVSPLGRIYYPLRYDPVVQLAALALIILSPLALAYGWQSIKSIILSKLNIKDNNIN
jgi:hypothetical protein